MKATGIVRRIDDLGRVVIPKEIRRTLRIREGDPLEIYTNREGEVIFKKYSPVSELSTFAGEYAAAINAATGIPCAITDRDNVIAYSGSGKNAALDRAVSGRCEQVIGSRRPFRADPAQHPFNLVRDNDQIKVAAAYPILAGGDLVGMIGLINSESRRVSPADEKVLSAGALFLGKQME